MFVDAVMLLFALAPLVLLVLVGAGRVVANQVARAAMLLI